MADKPQKSVIVFGVLGSESLDTSGEQLNIHGCDISSLPGGALNTEHVSSAEIAKEHDGEFKGFTSIVGKVLDCKKIFGPEDCENSLEQKAWDSLEVPMIVGTVEIFDGPDATDNQKAAASIARNHPELLGFSVEGQILERNNHVLKSSAVRQIALTMRPCNRSCRIISNLSNGESQNSSTVYKAEGGPAVLFKAQSTLAFVVHEKDFGLTNAQWKLRKALEAGMPTAAPGATNQGAALQKEQQPKSDLAHLLKLFGNKPLSKSRLRSLLPQATSAQLAKVYDHLKLLRLKKHEQDALEAFEQLKK